MATVTFNRSRFESLLSAALQETVDELAVAFEATIESSIFSWPRRTERSNGSIVGSPRDIVDTGTFRDSQSHALVNPLLVRFLWDIEYALIIFYGYITTGGNEYPGRDWIAAAFNEIDPLDVFADACRRVFR